MGVIWTTKSGAKLHSKDMSTEHIKNCIKLTQRKYTMDNITQKEGHKLHCIIQAFKAELRYRKYRENIEKNFRNEVRKEIRRLSNIIW